MALYDRKEKPNSPWRKKLVEDVRAMTSSLKNTVKRLRKLADDLDEVWSDCQRVDAVGKVLGS